MAENSIKTTSTSLKSSVAGDILLEEILLHTNEKFRLIFRPEIINNQQDQDACVRGSFLYQRKKDNDRWEDYKTFDATRLKAGEWIKLEIKSGALKKLMDELHKHKAIYQKYGLQLGAREYVFTSEDMGSLIQQLEQNKESLQEFLKKGGERILPGFIKWMSESEDPKVVMEKMNMVKADDLAKLQSMIGIARVKKLLNTWEANKTNSNEEFWQKTLKENSWVISQLFATPMVIIEEKAFVGGKGIENNGGRIADYAYKNKLTKNIAIVEIKTPITPIVGSQIYSGKIHPMTRELSIGVVEVLGQKDSLLKHFATIRMDSQEKFLAFNPKCILIVGSLTLSPTQQQSFDLYRESIDGLQIITYDELFEKAKLLLELLEGDAIIAPDDIPF